MTVDPQRLRLRAWPLAAKVILALALTLFPLGIITAMVAISNYQSVAAMVGSDSLTSKQMLGIAMPMLMWAAALLIGWIVARWLIVQPLARMRSAVERYTAGDKSVRIGGDSFDSREVGALADAFDAMADDIAKHEAELRDALDEQRRLTREVHHRVKNNLQIVSSLLSIQARDAASAEVAQAYATVQARVAALAIVHRWMYDSDTPGISNGVDLRALASDLCAGLEQSLASSEHIGISLVCDVDRLFVGQDTAVPVAFLITELISKAARHSAPDALSATVEARARGLVATLTIRASPFMQGDLLSPRNTDPASRIVNGMARQLRSSLRYDAASGSYSLDFPLPAA